MGSNGGEHIKISGNDAAECSETTIQIKIKTLDSQTFTLRVDKRVPVPELKDKIASVTGVLSEQQRLICRGKVLKDDQLLSAYRILSFFMLLLCSTFSVVKLYVEDGHTLHLVVRQPVPPTPESSSDQPGDTTASTGNNPGNRVGPGMVVGTFNISEPGDGAFPDLNRIVSAVLNSFGVTRFGSAPESIDLNQPPSERLVTALGLSGLRTPGSLHSDQATSTAGPVEPLQPPYCSIFHVHTFVAGYTRFIDYFVAVLEPLEARIFASAGGQNANSRNIGPPLSNGIDIEAAPCSSDSRGLLTPEFLAEVISSTRQLLVEQATECLLELAGQLDRHASVADALERSRIQSNAIRSGALFQNLGALLLELGRAIMTLRMGQTPADALVNAGPSVFISSAGPNPIMVQVPLPFQPGASFGSVPVGTVQHGSGLPGGSVSPSFLPRNIDIRIRTGSVFPRREPTGSQPQGQGAPVSTNSVDSGEREAAGLDSSSHNREPQLRAIPIRTFIGPASVGRGSDSSRGSIGILYPVLARVQHVTSTNPNGTRASQVSDQHHVPDVNSEQSIPDSTTQQQNTGVLGGLANLPMTTFSGNGTSPAEVLSDRGFPAQEQSGLEQLLRTIFPGEHAPSDNANPTGSVPSHSETAQVVDTSQEAASIVSDEAMFLSNILRQVMPIISENTGAAQDMPSVEGANSVDTRGDDEGASSRRRRSPQSQQNSKRQRTEKAFLKQPKLKKSGKGKAPGKGGNRYWKSIGLGFKTPREAIEDSSVPGAWQAPLSTYIDKKCPFTGNVSVRGRILAGTCHSAKMMRTIIVRRNYLHWVKKYQRYEKRHSNIPAHISPCFRVKEGDHVIIGQPLSKTVRFNVLKVIPAGSSGRGKKAFTGM
ncbi:Ubiquitin-like domain-containing protein CIP73 [Sesamum angolense]|uniref:Small ribosomal subunit protein uS17 n=1 Tax=Sesamum angolense TaxID=2727404 RepID=A0AAE1W8D2_9LAMI|nr:Ubiquitin-like domain-containing protein CIP73 [Sesamum angolense]